MERLKADVTEHEGNKIVVIVADWGIVKASYDPKTFEIVDFFIHGVKVTQDDLIVELADTYDTPWLRDCIESEEIDAAGNDKYYR